jgi:phage host-nuclease inhibitor protein Gam
MTEWNDGRLDDLSERVGRIETKMDDGFVHIDQRFKETDQKMEAGFARLDTKMDDGFARMDAKFDDAFARIDAKFDVFNERFDTMYQTLFKASWALVVGILGLLGVLVGVLAT